MIPVPALLLINCHLSLRKFPIYILKRFGSFPMEKIIFKTKQSAITKKKR